ncbi:hypothetical protein [Paenibacillus vini]|uniref:Uncharacterized protein n=1 Tax=Paenibacillus vini TaxID=1476024 RepID=A0ABQ4MI49_9BACL|nr:hypothetical protein [Paenibacillus vini]GIP55317.1 hypothetical protein J42TS3_43520 [Paenibacillus vini]
MNVDIDNFFTDEDLEDLLIEYSLEVCGLYMGDIYNEPTRIVNPQIKKLIDEFKLLKMYYMERSAL